MVLAQPIPLLLESEAPVVYPNPKEVPDDEHLYLRLEDMELQLLFARHIVISPFAPEGFDEQVRTEISTTGNFANVFPSELGPPGR